MSPEHYNMLERRRDVRVRPAMDYNVLAELLTGDLDVPLFVVNFSVGGMGVLVNRSLAHCAIGEMVKLRLSLPRGPSFDVEATIRHRGQPGFGICGFEFYRLARPAVEAIRACVSELLRRGQAGIM